MLTLMYYPLDRENDFQSNLYAESEKFGIKTVGIDRALSEYKAPDYFHIHWESKFFMESADGYNLATINEVRRKLSQLRSLGTKIIWTLHNSEPHESLSWQASKELRFALFEEVDIIHMMNVPGHFDLFNQTMLRKFKSKLLQTNHPAYENLGITENVLTPIFRERPSLIISSLGRMTMYKNLPFIVRAMSQVVSDGMDVGLILGGEILDGYAEELIRSEINKGLKIALWRERISSATMSQLVQQSDFGIAASRGMLNSGTLHFYLSHGVDFLHPDDWAPSVTDELTVRYRFTVDDLAEKIRSYPWHDRRTDWDNYLRTHDRRRVSDEFLFKVIKMSSG